MSMSRADPRKRQRRNSNSDDDQKDEQLHSKKMHSNDKPRDLADDRARLKKLSEREREAELFERHEQREILEHREEISKKLKSKTGPSTTLSDDDTDNEGNVPSNSFNKDIYAADDDDENRALSNLRKQKTTERNRTLQALIDERKKKQDSDNQSTKPKSVAVKKGSFKSSDTSASDDDGNIPLPKSSKAVAKAKLKVTDVYNSSTSEDDDNDNHRRSRSPHDHDKVRETERLKNKPISTKSELKPIVLSRFRMEKWCHAPFFSTVAKGAFVRINIGPNKGISIYRVCEIREVVETGKTYDLGSTRTNKGLRLRYGHHERVYRLEYVSDKEISDSEFKRWRETIVKQKVPLPTLEFRNKKIKEINQWKDYVFSNRDISKMVEEKSRFRKAPIKFAVSKNELNKEIEMARDDNDIKKEKELRTKLHQMEERASELDRKRSANISVMTDINRRNRQSTQRNVETALVNIANEHRNEAADPFTRRRCAPVLVSKAPQTKDELIRELQIRRIAEEEALAKKRLEEQRLLAEKTKAKRTTFASSTQITVDKQFPEKSLSTMTTHERGSFTSLSATSDEMFTSHNFELDFAIKIVSDQF